LARTFIIKKHITRDFRINHKGESPNRLKGANQPPKKQIDITTESHNMLLYSAKKNKAKVKEEYSTLYPATISASASGKSNGDLFVSANNEKKIINKLVKVEYNIKHFFVVLLFL